MFTLKNKLEALAKELLNPDNEILVLAEETNDGMVLGSVAVTLGTVAKNLKTLATELDNKIVEKIVDKTFDINEQSVIEIATLAEEFDASGDEFLQKQASVLDQVLLNMGVKMTGNDVSKLAQDKEVDKLREKYRTQSHEDSYDAPRQEHDRDILTTEALKAIKNSIKEYRPLETALSTRYCPDHPGVSAIRVGDYTYQCPLDKKVYPYKEGFTTMKGNVVPGTDVQNQTQGLGDRDLEGVSFSTREDKLS